MKKLFFVSALILLLLSIAGTVGAEPKISLYEIHEVARDGNLVRLKVLLQKNPKLINVKNNRGNTPLLEMLGWPKYSKYDKNNKEKTAFFLILKGADVNARDDLGLRPLHWTAQYGLINITKLLISKGADVNVINKTGETPLHAAAYYGHVKIAKLLIKNGADVNVKNARNKWVTPLSHAVTEEAKCSKSALEITKLLISHGADVNAGDCLHGSIQFNNNAKLVRLLISNGANVNAKDKNFGNTPLHYAAMYYNTSIAKILISKGANVNAKNKNGKTPLGIAKKYKKLAQKRQTRARPEMYNDVINLLRKLKK